MVAHNAFWHVKDAAGDLGASGPKQMLLDDGRRKRAPPDALEGRGPERP
jgi:hypothetical protein